MYGRKYFMYFYSPLLIYKYKISQTLFIPLHGSFVMHYYFHHKLHVVDYQFITYTSVIYFKRLLYWSVFKMLKTGKSKRLSTTTCDIFCILAAS